MSVNNTTQNTGFFKRVGNWFNKNGNVLGKSLQLAGTTAVGVGFTGMMLHEMNKSSCHHHGGSIWGGGFGGCCSPWNMGMSPYSMGGCGMFGGMSMLNSMYGMTNPYLTMAGLQSASNYGLMSAATARQNMFANPLYQSYYNQSFQKYQTMFNSQQSGKNYDADVDYTSNGKDEAKLSEAELNNTKKGEEMDTAFNKKNFKKFEYADSKASDEEKETALKEYAKSYVAYVDKEGGDGDGLISEDEFVEHEAVASTGSDTSLRKAFKQFDLNNDEQLDWKEYAALMRTYDRNSDGTITAEEVSKAKLASDNGLSRALRQEDAEKDIFRQKLEGNYKD